MSLSQVLLFLFILVNISQQEPQESEQEPLNTNTSQVVEVNLSSLEESALKSVSLGAQRFAVQLYSFIAGNNGSVIVSPMSLQIVLALAFFGARGVTATELATLLFLSEANEETTLLGYKSLIRVVQDPVLNLADRIFVEKSAPVKDVYQQVAKENFFSAVEPLDFKTAPEESRKQINTWAERQTNDRIKDLLAAGSISSETRFVLVNAIYFKANWKNQFDKTKTKEQTFFPSSAEEIKVQMMNIESSFEFFHDYDLGAKFLRLNYDGEKFEMIVILPDDYNGLSDLEMKLETMNIFEKVQRASYTKVDVYLPKFKIERTIELNKVLNAMGAVTMFSNFANFSGISDGELSVSYVVQKAFIEVTEEGTEAAAVTAVIMKRSASIDPSEPLEEQFIADHPFIYLIVLKKYRVPLFCGRFTGSD